MGGGPCLISGGESAIDGVCRTPASCGKLVGELATGGLLCFVASFGFAAPVQFVVALVRITWLSGDILFLGRYVYFKLCFFSLPFDQVVGRCRLAYNDEGTHEAVKEFLTESDLSIRLINQDKVVGFIFTIPVSLVVSLFLLLLNFWPVLLHQLSSFDGLFSGFFSELVFCHLRRVRGDGNQRDIDRKHLISCVNKLERRMFRRFLLTEIVCECNLRQRLVPVIVLAVNVHGQHGGARMVPPPRKPLACGWYGVVVR